MAKTKKEPEKPTEKKPTEETQEALDALSENGLISLAALQPYLQDVDGIMPFFREAIKDYENTHDCSDITFIDILRTTDPETGKPTESILEQLLQQAQEKAEKEHPTKEKGVKISRADKVEYPLDKINNEIWSLLEKDTGGQISLKAEKAGSKKQLDILYSIDFDALDGTGIKITKRLTAFDKRVYIAVSALFNAGNNVITLTQIYYAMGNTGRPDTTALDKIQNSVTKMIGAKIFVDNTQEASEYNYPKFQYDGVLLPVERVTETVNGKVTDAAIHIFREPPVITFAKQRNQITTIDVKCLQSPVSKTEQNLSIEDYLIERIYRAKKGKQPARILYNTICDRAKLTTAKQRQRLPGKVERYLKYYKSCGVISDYTTDKDGITVVFDNEIPG